MTPAHRSCIPHLDHAALPHGPRAASLPPACCGDRTGWLLALMVLLAALPQAGCGHSSGRPAHPDPVPAEAAAAGARVFRIQATGELLRGPLAAAQTGDFRLENPQVAILIQGLGRPHAGAIVDAGWLPEGRDALRSISLRVGDKRPSAVRYTRIETQMVKETAVLRLHGHHPRYPRLRILTEYRLGPQEPSLEIQTTFISGERRALDITVSDQIDLGLATPYAPGLGLFPEGKHQLDWLAAGANAVSYGYFRPRGQIKLHISGPVAIARLGAAKLVRGGRASFTRTLAVGGGGLGAAVLGPMLRGRGVELSRLTVVLYSPLGDTIPGAAVMIDLEGKPFCMGRTFQDGVLPLELPPGAYTITARPRDRLAAPVKVMVRPPQAQVIRVTAGPPSRLIFEVRQQDKAPPFPTMLTISGLDSTPTPWMGAHRTFKKHGVFYSSTGQGSLPMPPGQYRITASHGAEFTTYSEDVTLHPESGGSIVARLRHVVSHEGYLTVDPGQLSPGNPGCALSLPQRSLLNRAEGLAAAVLLSPEGKAPARKKLPVKKPSPAPAKGPTAEPFPLWPGFTTSTPELGQVCIFPRVEGARLPRLLQSPGQALVVLNPDSRTGGLLERLGLDPERPEVKKIPALLSAVNMMSVNRAAQFDALLMDWLALLNAGRPLTAVGSSGCRASYLETSGPARTYVKVPAQKGPISREQVYEALARGQAVVSNGPFVRLSIQDKGPGETITLGRSRRRRGKGSKLTVHVIVSAPARQRLDSLTLYYNGEIITTPTPIANALDGVQLDKKIVVTVKRDGYIVALVKGQGSADPQAPLPPLALSNPIWIDYDGDGKIAPWVADKGEGATGR